MDVGGVAQEEGAAVPEAVRNPVVHPIGREPVHRAYGEPQVLDGFVAYIVEAQLTGPDLFLFAFLFAHQANQSNPPLLFHREQQHEVGVLQIDMQLPVDRRTRRIHVGHVEEP